MRKNEILKKNNLLTGLLISGIFGGSLLFGGSLAMAENKTTILTSANVTSANATEVDSLINELNYLKNGDGTKTIVLDAGHGGHDPGAVNYKNGQEEAPLNLDIALRVKRLLELKGYNVVLTRSMHSQYLGLYERVLLSNQDSDSILYVSIHSNATESHNANGVETWYKTNDEYSKNMGSNISKCISKRTNQINRGTNNTELYIDYSQKPAVLIECGFLDNDEDFKLLTTRQNDFALGIVEGILSSINF